MTVEELQPYLIQYRSRLYQYAKAVVSNKDAANEALHDMFELALSTVQTYDPQRSSVVTWLTLLLKQVIRRNQQEYWREQRRTRIILPLTFSQYDMEEAADIEHLSDELLYLPTENERISLEQALMCLGGMHERVVRLAFIGGYTYAEIEAETGISRRKVRRMVFTALKRLRRILQSSISERAQQSMEESENGAETETISGSE